jgi:3-dehydroquinate dehydratase-1
MDLFARTDASFVRNELDQLRRIGLPLLATFRPESEGGAWTGGEEERKQRLLECIEFVDAVDIELHSAEINIEISKACKKAGKTLIVSNHSLDGTPENSVLQGRIDAAKNLGADVVKLACLAETEADVSRLLVLLAANRDKGMIGISMGAKGAISRVVAPLFGSLLTYTSLDLNYGQLPLEELIHFLKAFYPAFDEELIKRRHPPNARVP